MKNYGQSMTFGAFSAILIQIYGRPMGIKLPSIVTGCMMSG